MISYFGQQRKEGKAILTTDPLRGYPVHTVLNFIIIDMFENTFCIKIKQYLGQTLCERLLCPNGELNAQGPPTQDPR